MSNNNMSNENYMSYFQSLTEEIRFLKRQQINITNYSILIFVAFISILKFDIFKDNSDILILLKISFILISSFTLLYAIFFIIHTQYSLVKCRKRLDNIISKFPEDFQRIHFIEESNIDKISYLSIWYDWKFFIPFIVINLIGYLILILIIKTYNVSENIDILEIIMKIFGTLGIFLFMIGLLILFISLKNTFNKIIIEMKNINSKSKSKNQKDNKYENNIKFLDSKSMIFFFIFIISGFIIQIISFLLF